MKIFRRWRIAITIIWIISSVFAGAFPPAAPVMSALAAPDSASISGMVYVNGVAAWDGFGVKITNNTLGTTAWTTTSGGWYSFPNLNGGTYTISHNHNCPSDTPRTITTYTNSQLDIHINCTYTIWGRVMIGDRPAHDGFTVRLTNKATGQEYWPAVAGGDGWYSKAGVVGGWYTVTHWDTSCPSNNNFDSWVGDNSTTITQISLTCPKYEVWGRVMIGDRPAHDGFTVRLKNKETGQEYWPAVAGGDGWYHKVDVAGGWYTVTHWDTSCPSNNNFDSWVGDNSTTITQITLTCPKYEVWGRVMIGDRPAHDGFTVRLKNKETGQEYWPAVAGGDGWYTKQAVEQGWYTVTHWDTSCPGNNNFDSWVGDGSTTITQITLTCPKPKFEVWGRVKIDGKAAQDGFAVRLKNKSTGQEYWPKVEGGDGWYHKVDVEEGWYTVTHYDTCPGNNNFDAWVGTNSTTIPEINLTCPKPKYQVWGRVMIDGKAGHDGFTVRLTNKATGEEFWPAVAGGDGWYTKQNVPEGTYTVTHWHPCAGNNNFEFWVGKDSYTVTQINLTCELPKAKFSVNGTVTIDGQLAQNGFGVKAVSSSGVAKWVIISNSQGSYSFDALEEGEYYIGHNYPCSTIQGNPVKIYLGSNTTQNITIKCTPDPTPTPPPILPDICDNNVGLVPKSVTIDGLEIPVSSGPGFQITRKLSGSFGAKVCPEFSPKLGAPDSNIAATIQTRGGEVTLYKDGSMSSSADLVGNNVSVECHQFEMITPLRSRASCAISFSYSGAVPNANLEAFADIKIEEILYVERGDIALVALATGTQEFISNTTDFMQRHPVLSAFTAVTVGTLARLVFEIVKFCKDNAQVCLGLLIIAPSSVNASAINMTAVSSQDLTEALKVVFGDSIASTAVITKLEAVSNTNSIVITASNLPPQSHHLLLILPVEKIFPGENPIEMEVVYVDTAGNIENVVTLERSIDKALVLLIDLDSLDSDLSAYLNSNVDSIALKGRGAVLHRNVQQNMSVYLPLIQR